MLPVSELILNSPMEIPQGKNTSCLIQVVLLWQWVRLNSYMKVQKPYFHWFIEMCHFPLHFSAEKSHWNSYCLQARGTEREKKPKEWYFFIKLGTLGLSKLLQTTAYPASGDP